MQEATVRFYVHLTFHNITLHINRALKHTSKIHTKLKYVDFNRVICLT